MVLDLVHSGIDANFGRNPDGNCEPFALKNSRSKERTEAARDQQGPEKAPDGGGSYPNWDDYDPKWVVHSGAPSCYF